MALLESCICCSLLTGSAIFGLFIMVCYLVAFVIEMSWVWEAEGIVPVPAYLLCIVYFVLFLSTAYLLLGLTLKKMSCFIGWTTIMLSVTPVEAGLVIYISVFHWKLTSLFGISEFAFWLWRLVFDVIGVISIQSLYSNWRNEHRVLKNLQVLNLLKHGQPPMGYENSAFLRSTTNVCESNKLRRSLSTSQINICSGVIYDERYPQNCSIDNFYKPHGRDISEFNASSFKDGVPALIVADDHANRMSRARSMTDLSFSGKMNDYWQPQAVKYPEGKSLYTQSLDRRKLRKWATMDEMNRSYANLNHMQPSNRYHWSVHCQQLPQNYWVNGSKRSLTESEDFRKYRDIAL